MPSNPCHCPAPGNEDLPCSGCNEPTVREQLTERMAARGLTFAMLGATADIVDALGLVVFTGDAGQVSDWLDNTPAPWTFDGALLTNTRQYLDVDRPDCTTGRGFLDARVRRIGDDGKPGAEVVALPDAAIDAMDAYYLRKPIVCGECAACRDADDREHRVSHAAGNV